MNKPKSPCILYVCTFPPRECGIATFTQDLTNAIDKEFNPEIKSKILAMKDNPATIYNYPRKVIFQINETDIEDYLELANKINKSPEIKAVNIQHEYGLFGGEWGNYLLPFLALLKKPIITTFHTILPRPDKRLKKITKSIGEKSSGIVVMTKTAARILEKTYGFDKKKINVIPHGVHHVAYPSKANAKKKLNLSGRTVLSTFGMLNRDKGIEYAIESLPEVIKKYPKILYLVIGATHPLIRRQEGEKYRNKLMRLVAKYKLQDHVKFYDKYLDLAELIDYLKATDIYISPTLNPKQSVSGTISYALSCACPVIATANQYAKDTINNERGILVRFENSLDIKNALLNILGDKQVLKEMRKNTYFYSRHMTWQNVALSYFKLFNENAKIVPRQEGKYPIINFDHLKKLTDKFGIIQFAQHTKPDPNSGYCLDDAARALLACAMDYEKNPLKNTLNFINIYFDFIKFVQKSNGKFHNFVTYERKFNDIEGESHDSFGRAIWILGYIIGGEKIPENLKKQAYTMLKKTYRWMPYLESLRAISFSIIGLSYAAEKIDDKKIVDNIKRLADKLTRKYKNQTNNSQTKDWLWFEDCLTYSNHKLPEALLRAYKATKHKEYLQIAEESLNFLIPVNFLGNEYFAPIGQDGWYFKGGKRALFDQQPEDTAAAVEAFATAYEITKNKKYKEKAELAFMWFLGKNHLNQMIYDEATGGCYDGLGKYSINFNQGAESTISYLLARLTIENINKN